MRQMDHFFGSVSTLMSNCLRSGLQNSIYDLVEWLEYYLTGNEYEGDYTQSPLRLPTMQHPITIFMVSGRVIIFGFTQRTYIRETGLSMVPSVTL